MRLVSSQRIVDVVICNSQFPLSLIGTNGCRMAEDENLWSGGSFHPLFLLIDRFYGFLTSSFMRNIQFCHT
jgi:hypothetical protein